jgi:hypothetical protein
MIRVQHGQIIFIEDFEAEGLSNNAFEEFKQQLPDMVIDDVLDPSKNRTLLGIRNYNRTTRAGSSL